METVWSPTVARGFGIAWDPEWIGPERLRVRGYRACGAVDAMARWDVEALLATVDGALEAAGWPPLDRNVASAALRELYAADLA